MGIPTVTYTPTDFLPTLYCIRCRGRAYGDEDALCCMACGRTLAIKEQQPRRTFTGTYAPEPINGPGVGCNAVKIRHSPDLKAICIGWMMEGESVTDVADSSGVGESTLLRWRKLERKRLWLSRTARPAYSPDSRAACVERIVAGVVVKDLAEETGVKVATLREWRLKARRKTA